MSFNLSSASEAERLSPRTGTFSREVRAYDAQLTEERLAKVFNTAFVSSLGNSVGKAATANFQSLMQSPAFKALLEATRKLAEEQQIPELAAAQQMIQTFQGLEWVWRDYVVSEGLERLKSSKGLMSP